MRRTSRGRGGSAPWQEPDLPLGKHRRRQVSWQGCLLHRTQKTTSSHEGSHANPGSEAPAPPASQLLEWRTLRGAAPDTSLKHKPVSGPQAAFWFWAPG